METFDNRVLHLVMSLSTKSDISFQTALAFAVILAASLSNVASVCEQQSKAEINTIYLCFVWSLLEPYPSKPVEETIKNVKVKITQPGQCLQAIFQYRALLTCYELFCGSN